MASLEQLADEQTDLAAQPAGTRPERDRSSPRKGRSSTSSTSRCGPSSICPTTRASTLRRPTHTFTDAEVETEKKRLLEPYGQLVPKEPPVVGAERLRHRRRVDLLRRARRSTSSRRCGSRSRRSSRSPTASPRISARRWPGRSPATSATWTSTLSQEIGAEQLRGRKVQAKFHVKDVKTIRQPELTRELLEDVFAVSTPEH